MTTSNAKAEVGAFPPGALLTDAQEWLRRRLDNDGAVCPCCKRVARIYRRKVHSNMVRGLIAMYRAGAADDYVHAPTVNRSSANVDTAKNVYWGLIEEAPEKREDGGRAGWYRLTPLGVDWLLGRATIPTFAVTYADRLLGHDGPPRSVQEALGTKFDYADLMAGR